MGQDEIVDKETAAAAEDDADDLLLLQDPLSASETSFQGRQLWDDYYGDYNYDYGTNTYNNNNNRRRQQQQQQKFQQQQQHLWNQQQQQQRRRINNHNSFRRRVGNVAVGGVGVKDSKKSASSKIGGGSSDIYGSFSGGYDCPGISIAILLIAAAALAIMFYVLFTKITMIGRRRKRSYREELAEQMGQAGIVAERFQDTVIGGKMTRGGGNKSGIELNGLGKYTVPNSAVTRRPYSLHQRAKDLPCHFNFAIKLGLRTSTPIPASARRRRRRSLSVSVSSQFYMVFWPLPLSLYFVFSLFFYGLNPFGGKSAPALSLVSVVRDVI